MFVLPRCHHQMWAGCQQQMRTHVPLTQKPFPLNHYDFHSPQTFLSIRCIFLLTNMSVVAAPCKWTCGFSTAALHREGPATAALDLAALRPRDCGRHRNCGTRN
jgi:hypothetical protein